jgi:hypothetical protein
VKAQSAKRAAVRRGDEMMFSVTPNDARERASDAGSRRTGAEIPRRSPLRPTSAQVLERSAEIELLAPQNDLRAEALLNQ